MVATPQPCGHWTSKIDGQTVTAASTTANRFVPARTRCRHVSRHRIPSREKACQDRPRTPPSRSGSRQNDAPERHPQHNARAHIAHFYVTGSVMERQGGDHVGQRVEPHTLRHAFITAALDAGVPSRDVHDAASHADPRTPMRRHRGPQSLDRRASCIVATSSPAPPADNALRRSVRRRTRRHLTPDPPAPASTTRPTSAITVYRLRSREAVLPEPASLRTAQQAIRVAGVRVLCRALTAASRSRGRADQAGPLGFDAEPFAVRLDDPVTPHARLVIAHRIEGCRGRGPFARLLAFEVRDHLGGQPVVGGVRFQRPLDDVDGSAHDFRVRDVHRA
jgi:hypothetical protein